MDNILKLVLGVLGISGMIAMVTTNLTFEPQSGSQPAAVQAPVIMEPVEENVDENGEPVSEEEVAESVEEDGDDIFAIGEPSIDGNPYGANLQQPMPSEVPPPVDMTQAGNFNYNNAVPQYYNQQQNSAPQPPQIVYAPAVAEGQ